MIRYITVALLLNNRISRIFPHVSFAENTDYKLYFWDIPLNKNGYYYYHLLIISLIMSLSRTKNKQYVQLVWKKRPSPLSSLINSYFLQGVSVWLCLLVCSLLLCWCMQMSNDYCCKLSIYVSICQSKHFLESLEFIVILGRNMFQHTASGFTLSLNDLSS